MSRFADVTTNTPHGPRPVPEGHIPADDAPPPKDLRSTLLIWGGVGLALTVGALAARAAAGAVSGDSEEDRPRPVQGPRPRHAPRYASMGPQRRARMRARANADFIDYDDQAAEIRAAAQRARRRRAQQSEGFGDGIGSAARNIVALIGAAGTALEGFRTVSANSDEIMRNFSDAADRLQEFLGTRSSDDPKRSPASDDSTARYTKAEMSDEDRRMRNL
ncbi:hypothetical protein [Paracoccus albus]|uniref:hypothetical protein n=1 Tax=Paracoccus albus TaxID=3017784 RepID=UPI0022F065D8|nr:hypothetical protein [Paracoccus albus]WBU60614.1 hypothetical protein PAF20_01430 [Paracoccus albus]